ncbi:MAG: hypothetical protein LBC82_02395 [Oscillospiraceae bacterium]|nr:hypothetical protein [Oscillospiraceae bacterium]
MNLIICNESCRHQKDGYCCLEGSSQITNALASPCCYYEETQSPRSNNNQNNSGYIF